MKKTKKNNFKIYSSKKQIQNKKKLSKNYILSLFLDNNARIVHMKHLTQLLKIKL